MSEFVKVFVEGIGSVGEFPKGSNISGQVHSIVGGMQITHPGDRLNYTILDNRGNRVGGGDLVF